MEPGRGTRGLWNPAEARGAYGTRQRHAGPMEPGRGIKSLVLNKHDGLWFFFNERNEKWSFGLSLKFRQNPLCKLDFDLCDKLGWLGVMKWIFGLCFGHLERTFENMSCGWILGNHLDTLKLSKFFLHDLDTWTCTWIIVWHILPSCACIIFIYLALVE